MVVLRLPAEVAPGSKTIERQAHAFAAEFLAPTAELEPDLPNRVDWDQLLRAKQKWGLSLAALAYRAHTIGLWSEHSYRRANLHLRAAGYPEQGPLGPPESPTLIGAAMDLLAQAGTTVDDLARVSRLTVEQINDVVQSGSDTKPRLRLSIETIWRDRAPVHNLAAHPTTGAAGTVTVSLATSSEAMQRESRARRS